MKNIMKNLCARLGAWLLARQYAGDGDPAIKTAIYELGLQNQELRNENRKLRIIASYPYRIYAAIKNVK